MRYKAARAGENELSTGPLFSISSTSARATTNTKKRPALPGRPQRLDPSTTTDPMPGRGYRRPPEGCGMDWYDQLPFGLADGTGPREPRAGCTVREGEPTLGWALPRMGRGAGEWSPFP